ncbi:MAG: DUF2269 family protein [Anaerolineales bacterium]
MYDVILFLHVASVLGYFLVHGAFASVSFALNRETEPRRLKALESVFDLTGPWSLGSALVMVVTGLVLMVMGNWWRDGWAWLSLLIFIVIGVVMILFGGVQIGFRFEREERPAEGERWYTVVEWGLRLGSRIPLLLTVTGMTALVLILWLMMFKPF